MSKQTKKQQEGNSRLRRKTPAHPSPTSTKAPEMGDDFARGFELGELSPERKRQFRSAAAKRGWETRAEKKRQADAIRGLLSVPVPMMDQTKVMADLLGRLPALAADPNPWPRFTAWIKAQWRRVMT